MGFCFFLFLFLFGGKNISVLPGWQFRAGIQELVV